MLARSEQCINHSLKNGGCNQCTAVCPTDALVVDQGIHLQAERCVDCGLCTSACRQGVFMDRGCSLQYPSLSPEQHGYTCRNVGEWTGMLQLPCLGVLDETELVTAAAALSERNKDHETLVHLDLWFGSCEGCSWSKGKDMAIQAVEFASSLIKTLELPVKIRLHTVDRAIPGPSSQERRDFLFFGWKWMQQGLKKQVEKKVSPIVELFPENRSDRNQMPSKRQSEMVKMILMRRRSLVAELPALNKGVVINKDCTLCKICTEICPSEALLFQQDQGECSIVFKHFMCTDCGACEKGCPRKAIKRIDQQWVTNTEEIVKKISAFQCLECGESHPAVQTDSLLCSLCKNKKELLKSIWG